MANKSIVLVLTGHHPYIRKSGDSPRTMENSYFEMLADVYLPLLRVFSNLEADGIPFKLALCLSSQLCALMEDEQLALRFVAFLEKQYALTVEELTRHQGDPALQELITQYLHKITQNRRDFVESYGLKILHKLSYYADKGNIELLATSAGSAFLPLYNDCPELINAQIEMGLISHRHYFGTNPAGFWLPSMGYTGGLEYPIKNYGYLYTILDSHGLLFANPAPSKGTFAPVFFNNNLSVFGRDRTSVVELTNADKGFVSNKVYRNQFRDIGFELSPEELSAFSDEIARPATGLKYWNKSGTTYSIDRAEAAIRKDIKTFLSNRITILDKASEYMKQSPTCVCALPAEFFGKDWYEGPRFLELLFREAVGRGLTQWEEIKFETPSEVLAHTAGSFNSEIQDVNCVREKVKPVFSSWADDGYAESWLDSSNEWMYRYARNASLQMVDLANRFPDDFGLKERALNLAAREILLAQDSQLALMVRNRIYADYASEQFEEHISAFITVYDSLGGNSVSTEWLTSMERRYPVFPNLNYRIFRPKK